jgi:hypothetical protein
MGFAPALLAILFLAFSFPAFAAVTLTSDFDGGNVSVISVSAETDGPIYERHGIQGDAVLTGKHVTIEAQIKSRCHNWFFLRLDGVKGKTVTVNLHPWDGAPTNGMEKNDFRNWHGLHPVMTYGDPEKYETYEWFTKDDQGRWTSGDVFRQGDAGLAGTGNAPQQDAISASAAGQFLSEDGRYWQPWRDIVDTRVLDDDMTFRLTQHFTEDTAWVAMRVPYTYTYLQTFLARLKAANLPGVFVDEIGMTPKGRHVQAIRVDDPAAPATLHIDEVVVNELFPTQPSYWVSKTPTDAVAEEMDRVFVASAREHATEAASSWMVQGLLRSLLRPSIEGAERRRGNAWILFPIQDPDGSADSTFDRLTAHFRTHQNDPVYGNATPPEVLGITRYLRAFVNGGYVVECVTGVHGLESDEGVNVMCPFAIRPDIDATVAFNARWFEQLRKSGVVTGSDDPAQAGASGQRLPGWCRRQYGPLALAFEVNDRCPKQRLSQAQMEDIGAGYPETLLGYLETEVGKSRAALTRTRLAERNRAAREFWKTMPIVERVPFDYVLLGKGF